MGSFCSKRILEIWESSNGKTAETKIRSLLSLMLPELSVDEIGELILGERNGHLLALRQQLFGSKLQAYIECVECGDALDLEFLIDDLDFDSITLIPKIHTLSFDKFSAIVTLPDGNVLQVLALAESAEKGRFILFDFCIQHLYRDKKTIVISDLSDNELNLLEAEIGKLDPRMEILLDMQCPNCSYKWQLSLDLGTFVWREFDGYAKQLIENVHLLANSYGWSENDILSMSNIRRHYYVERLLI